MIAYWANGGLTSGLPLTVAATLLALAPLQSFAQSPVTVSDHPSFEVASVKPKDPSKNPGVLAGTYSSPTRHNYVGSLQTFIKQAYDVRDVQISGGPKWLDHDLFEIDAKTSAPASTDQLNLMLQALLADRFKLALHSETKQLPVFTLVPGKNGPKLPRAEGPGGFGVGRGFVRGLMDTATLARCLASILGRTVVDETGLQSTTYRVALTWTPDDQPPTSDQSGPSIFTAIQEQLGLRLAASKGPVRILVIDHAETLSTN